MNENMEWKELMDRWDSRLLKIKNTAKEMLEEAQQKSQEMIQSTTFDTAALVHAWSAVENQVVRVLHRKAEKRWDKINDEMDENDSIHYTGEQLTEEAQKLDDLLVWLEGEYHSAYITTMAQAAKKIYKNALETVEGKETVCRNCGATLPFSEPVFHAINHKCEYCGFVQTYEPSDALKAVETFAVQFLAEYAALEYWKEMRQLQQRMIHFEKNVPEELVEKYKEAAKKYWTTFYTKSAEVIPEYAKHTERYIASKMEWVYKEVNK